jgi:hypothetical protein
MQFNLTKKFNVLQADTTLKGPHNLINTMAAVSAVYPRRRKAQCNPRRIERLLKMLRTDWNLLEP